MNKKKSQKTKEEAKKKPEKEPNRRSKEEARETTQQKKQINTARERTQTEKAKRCFFTEKAGLGSSADDYISELVVLCTHGTIHCRYLSA